MSTAFDADLGTYQGQIPKAGAPDGDSVYELGHALPGVVRSFTDGDQHAVSQTGSLVGKTLVRFTLDLRPPEDIPSGMAWTFSLTIGAQVLAVPILPGRARRRVDLAMNVLDIGGGGDQTLEFALTVSGASGVTYAAEMPSVQLDAVILDDATASPVFTCRDPEPNDTGVPVDQAILFTITDPAGGGATPSVTDVYVNGELVVDGGVAQPGWTFADGASDPYTTPYTLTPDDPFASLEQVTVRVLGHSDAGTTDQTWSYRCEDLLAPTLVQVLGFARQEVRVQFDEPVEQGDGTGAHDALNPANYVLSLSAGAPAVVPGVSSVESLGGDVVVLHLDDQMTPGATYLLTIPAVADAAGNVVANPGLQGLFAGYRPPSPAGRRSAITSLYQQVADQIRSLDLGGTKDLERFLACLQEPTDQLLADVDAWTDILDVDLAPEPFVDAMLVDLGNPFEEFSAAFSLPEKRKLAKLLVPLSKQKGTDPGMVNAIRILLGIEVTIEVPARDGVWSLGDSELGVDTVLGSDDIADLYSFWVVSPVELTAEQRVRIRKIVAYMRRAPTHLVDIIEPPPAPVIPDDWELGLSELGVGTLLH